jgi:uncharacterized protein YfaS (alpha-2-macroglobulin family)
MYSEHSVSRVLPNAMVGRAFEGLGVQNETLLADLPAMVELGLQKIYGFQHNDGGWGWWYDDTSNEYQTAYVLFGLAATRDAGYEVDAGVVERGATWLKGQVGGMDARTAAYALYALTMVGDQDILESAQVLADGVLAGDVEPDAFSRAALAIALLESGDAERAQSLVDGLTIEAKATDDEAYWPTWLEDGTYRQKSMASTTRTTALALDALVRVEPEHPLVAKAVHWLLGQRQGKSWGTTQETTYALLALTDYLLANRERAADYEYEVLVNGSRFHHGSFDEMSALGHTLTITAADLKPGENQIRVVKNGDGPLYVRLSGYVYRDVESVNAAGEIGVERQYRNVATDELLGAHHRAKVGDLVRVELTVHIPDESWYVIVEDHLPAGLEGLNERLATTSYVAREYGDEEFSWQNNGYNRKDVLDDRVALFITRLTSGTHAYSYLARVTHAGTFYAPPAQAYLMYAPEVWGRSGSDELIFDEGR